MAMKRAKILVVFCIIVIGLQSVFFTSRIIGSSQYGNILEQTITHVRSGELVETGLSPITNIFYLKIHKCSSSSMEGIFTRFAIHHRLKRVTFKGTHTFPSPVMAPYVITDFKDLDVYNILPLHVVFSENQIRQILPAGAKMITILREPFQLLQSAFDNFKLCSKFNMPVCSLREFLSNPEKYDTKAHQTYVRDYKASYTRNFMATHLGYANISPPSFNVTDWITYIDDRFHFIGLTEYLPESLVYMRRLLHWDIKDVIVVTLRNTTMYRSPKPGKKLQKINVTATQEQRAKYRQWSPVDHALYDYFLAEFRRKTDALGDDFRQEVALFTRVQDTVEAFCRQWCPVLNALHKNCTITDRMGYLRSTRVTFAKSRWNEAFYMRLEDCLMLMLNSDSVRQITMQRKRHTCVGEMCEGYIAGDLPPKSVTYLACIGDYGM